jgi:uncharacterized phosphosugar-binding protein
MEKLIMSTPSDTEIELMVNFTRQVFKAAQQFLESMQDGERVQIKQLAQNVSTSLSRDPKKVLVFINHFAHSTSMAYVSRGKNGGLVKGVKPVKIIKPHKAVDANSSK